MSDAVIHQARLAAAHDGEAELIVALRFANGAIDEVTLDEPSARALMQFCQAQSVDDLIGKNWQVVRDALTAGWNRYNK